MHLSLSLYIYIYICIPIYIYIYANITSVLHYIIYITRLSYTINNSSNTINTD